METKPLPLMMTCVEVWQRGAFYLGFLIRHIRWDGGWSLRPFSLVISNHQHQIIWFPIWKPHNIISNMETNAPLLSDTPRLAPQPPNFPLVLFFPFISQDPIISIILWGTGACGRLHFLWSIHNKIGHVITTHPTHNNNLTCLTLNN